MKITLLNKMTKLHSWFFFKCVYPDFNKVKEEELNETVRGEGGFGSTDN